MASFEKCENCGEFGFIDTHVCDPEWEAILYDYDDPDEPERAFGMTAEYAAEYFAEKNWSDWEYPEEMEIWVRKKGDKDWTKLDVMSEMEPRFSTSEK